MAQYTKEYALTSAWQEISAGEQTVLVQVNDVKAGRVVLAVVDTVAGDGAGIVAQHFLTPHDNPIANFYNLNGKRVVAKKRAAAESPYVIVTAY